jgi:hypothetical protein
MVVEAGTLWEWWNERKVIWAQKVRDGRLARGAGKEKGCRKSRVVFHHVEKISG